MNYDKICCICFGYLDEELEVKQFTNDTQKNILLKFNNY